MAALVASDASLADALGGASAAAEQIQVATAGAQMRGEPWKAQQEVFLGVWERFRRCFLDCLKVF